MPSRFDYIKWHGRDVIGEVRRGSTKNLTEAAKVLHGGVKAAISTPSRTVTYKITRTGKTRKVYGVKGGNPSKPGEPPHRMTGELRRGLYRKTFKVRRAARVGSKAPHAGLLEYGTENMAPRPYLRSTLKKMASQLAAIICKPIRPSGKAAA